MINENLWFVVVMWFIGAGTWAVELIKYYIERKVKR